MIVIRWECWIELLLHSELNLVICLMVVVTDCVRSLDYSRKYELSFCDNCRCLQADSWRVVSASDDRTLKVSFVS